MRIAGEVEDPVGAPHRLSDRLAFRAGDASLVGEGAVLGKVCDVELRALEGQQRVVPGGPGEPPPIGADPRGRVEISAGGDHDRLRRAVRRKRDELVDGLAVDVVPLADADDQPAVRRHPAVRIPMGVRRGRLRRDRPRLCTRAVEPVDAAVVEACAPDRVAEPPVGAAAVLVDPRPDVEARRDDVDGITAGGTEDERRPALLVRPALRPVDPVLGCVDASECDVSLAGQQVDGDRRLPRAVRGDCCHECIRTRAEASPARPARTRCRTRGSRSRAPGRSAGRSAGQKQLRASIRSRST